MTNFQEIDIHLQKCIDMGSKAFLNGLTKYDNDFEPGSLSFDAWGIGFSTAEKDFKLKQDDNSKLAS